MNNITIELSLNDEDRKRVDLLTDAIKEYLERCAPIARSTPSVKTTAETQAPAQVEAQKAPEKVEKEEPKKAEAQTEPEVKLADIQRLVVSLATNGKKAEARNIVIKYADRVTAIPADKYAEVYNLLKALEV